MIILDRPLLASFRTPGPCEMCHRMSRSRREPHHVIHRGMGGGRRLDIRINLISLGMPCGCSCHSAYHTTGELQPEDFLATIAKREHTTVADIQAVTRWLLALDQKRWQQQWRERWEELTMGQQLLAQDVEMEMPDE